MNGDKEEADFYETDGVRRLRSDGTRYTSSGGVSLADMRLSSVPVSYIQGHQLLGLQQDESISFFLADALGSVRQVADTSGATVATFATDEYGVPDPAGVSGSAELLAHTYVGGLGVRNETGVPSGVAARGLYYMQARWYDAARGAFISADPVGFAGGDLNLYGYAGASPTNLVDPSGLNPGILILIGLGLAAEAWGYATGQTEANHNWAIANDKVKVGNRMMSRGTTTQDSPQALRVVGLLAGVGSNRRSIGALIQGN